MKNSQNMYETKISDVRWIAYDIPGNIGWILYIVFWMKLMKAGVEAYSIIAAVPAVLMIIGIIELISERIHKLDRVLPKVRLYRGFGSLTLGGGIGIVVSVGGLMMEGHCGWSLLMLAGSILCAIFAGLLFAGYKKKRE